MFDEETEQLAEELGLAVAFPTAELRHRMDSKIETTRLGEEAGVPSVPNTMGRGTDYGELLTLAANAGLGQMVLNASNFLRTDVVIMGIIVIGFFAVLFEFAMRRLEAWLVPWKGKV